MNFFFKVNADENIGVGHLQRCINLAKIIKERNHKVIFLINFKTKKYTHKIKKEKILVKIFKNDREILNLAKNIFNPGANNFLIVDDYSVNYKWEVKISKYVNKLLTIDDFKNKKHHCDIYLNQNILDEKEYLFLKKKYLNKKPLLGPKYALLDKKYNFFFKKDIKKNIFKKILISFGGSDKENFTNLVLEILSKKKYSNLTISVILGKDYKYLDNLKKKYGNYKNIKIIKNLPTLVHEMNSSNLTIGAGGITSWERLCLSIPSIVFCISKNQKTIIKDLKKRKLIMYGGNVKGFNKKKIENFIDKTRLNYLSINKKMEESKTYVDGMGATRVFENLIDTNSESLVLKKTIKSDIYDYFNLVNDRKVRLNSFNQKKILFKSHKRWFLNQLFSKSSRLYKLTSKNLLVGQGRLNIDHLTAKIDYSIAEDFRGRGWGYVLLKKLLNKAKNEPRIKKIVGEVRSNNKNSIKLFKNLDFKILPKKNKIQFYKDI